MKKIQAFICVAVCFATAMLSTSCLDSNDGDKTFRFIGANYYVIQNFQEIEGYNYGGQNTFSLFAWFQLAYGTLSENATQLYKTVPAGGSESDTYFPGNIFLNGSTFEAKPREFPDINSINGQYKFETYSTAGDYAELGFKVDIKNENILGDFEVDEASFIYTSDIIRADIEPVENAEKYAFYVLPISEETNNYINFTSGVMISALARKMPDETLQLEASFSSSDFYYNKVKIYPAAIYATPDQSLNPIELVRFSKGKILNRGTGTFE